MPRRIKECARCKKRFVAVSARDDCPTCGATMHKKPKALDTAHYERRTIEEAYHRQRPDPKQLSMKQDGKDSAIVQTIVDPKQPQTSESSESKNARPKVENEVISLLDDDGDDEEIDECSDEGSEGGQEIYCTQIEEEDDISSDDEEGGLSLSEFVSRKRLSLDVIPVTPAVSSEKSQLENNRAQGGVVSSAGPQNSGGYSQPVAETVDEKEIVLKGAAPGTDNDNANLDVCSICGASLKHIETWKGRVNHVKRCQKIHGHDHHDIRSRIEEETIYTSNDKPKAESPQSSQNPDAEVPASQPAPKPARVSSVSVMDMLMQGARKLAKAVRTKQKHGEPGKSSSGGRKRSFQQTYSQPRDPATVRACLFYKKISGTDFIVDGFHFAKPGLTENYFLTHYHSDHYGGIRKAWNYGKIYCSEPTANLVNSQLGVDRQYLHPLPMNKPITIETRGKIKVTVTLIDANHCPGAVMFLFKVRNRHILHVGDFRWNRQKMTTGALAPFCSRELNLDELYLDTTYCNAKYTLPSQEDAIQAAIEFAERAVNQAQTRKQKLLVLFGAYTIGKERIYLAVAKRLGMKVYVDRRRFRILSQFGWSQEQMSLLTTDPKYTCLWVVPLGHCSMKNLPNYLSVEIGKSFSRTYDRVVGFRPTGWSMQTAQTAIGGGKGGLIKCSTRGKVTSCGVPYSEHSSFPELCDCLVQLRPQKIIPTVSVSKAKEQVDLLLRHSQRKA